VPRALLGSRPWLLLPAAAHLGGQLCGQLILFSSSSASCLLPYILLYNFVSPLMFDAGDANFSLLHSL